MLKSSRAVRYLTIGVGIGWSGPVTCKKIGQPFTDICIGINTGSKSPTCTKEGIVMRKYSSCEITKSAPVLLSPRCPLSSIPQFSPPPSLLTLDESGGAGGEKKRKDSKMEGRW